MAKSERSSIGSGFKFFIRILKFTLGSLRGNWILAVVLFVFLVIACGFYEYTAYQVGLIASEFYSALTKKSYDRFTWTLVLSIIFVISISLTIAVRSMLLGHLSVMLRKAMTSRLHRNYFHARRFYTITSLMDVDNPDQRFTQDVGTVCNTVTEILPTLFVNPILVVFYTYKCVERAGWLGPISAYILFLVFTILTRLITTWTSASIYEQDRQEGNFRFLHAQLRSSGESAAFLDVGSSQQYFATVIFLRLLQVFRVSVNRKAVLLFITTMSAYVGAILNYMAIGIALFGGLFGTLTTSDVAVLISQTSFYLLYLINQFTNLIDLANKIANLVGVGHRILTLDDKLNDCLRYETPASYSASRLLDITVIQPTAVKPSHLKLPESDDVFLRLEHISLGLPCDVNHILIHDLSLTLQLNQPLYITGPSGTGKTALLRMLADLWPALPANPKHPEESLFYRSPLVNHVFVPQKPFIPSSGSCPSNLFDVLDFVGLTSFVSDPVARALHLAYLLLTLSAPPRDASLSELTLSVDHSSTSTHVPQEYAGPSFEESFGETYSDLDVYLCGYQLKSFIEAANLLVEFRLVEPKDAEFLRKQLAGYCADRSSSYDDSRCKRIGRSVAEVFRFGCTLEVNERKVDTTEWQTWYSPGEMQRLVLASVCYQRPPVAFLDEATSQLNAVDETQAYNSLRKRNITTISVAHHEGVHQFHNLELRLTPVSSIVPSGDDKLAHTLANQVLPQWELITYN